MRKRSLFILAALCLLLAGCGTREPEARARTVFAMDTVMNLTLYGGDDAALDAVEQELYRLDAALARTRAGSDVYVLNHDGSVRSADVARLAECAREISAATNGAFDVTIAPLLTLWGFGEDLPEQHVPDDAAISQALSLVGYERLSSDIGGTEAKLDLPAQVDLGGIAKGYAGERICACMEERGVAAAVADLGGDVCIFGAKPGGSPWRVAVKDPADGAAYLGVLETAGDVYVATSGVYERYFEENGVRYHHILDPRTGRSAASGLVSATVVCRDGVWADALATAACVLGAEDALALRETLADAVPFDLILVTDDARVLCACAGFTPETGNGYTYETIS